MNMQASSMPQRVIWIIQQQQKVKKKIYKNNKWNIIKVNCKLMLLSAISKGEECAVHMRETGWVRDSYSNM